MSQLAESIHHIQEKSKQKATTEQILNFLRKEDQCSDLPAADLEEEINTLVTTLFIRNLLNKPTKDKKMNMMILTTISIMKQVKMKLFYVD